MLKSMQEYGIGNTPVIEIESIGSNRLFLKLESHNYLGSIKARTAYGIMKGIDMPPNVKLVESTSGNLGMALNFFCREVGREFLCLIDETVVKSKQEHLHELGIVYKVIPCIEGLDGRESRIKYAKELSSTGNYYWTNQYCNEYGVDIHRKTTGPEIWQQTSGEVTAVVCALGSCGSVTGIGEFMHEQGTGVTIIGAEPYGSTIFHTYDAPYLTVGAGLRGKPGNLLKHPDAVDIAYAISDETSIANCKKLNKQYNVDVGITTGMAYEAAKRYCEGKSNEMIVIVAPDGMEYYRELL